MFENLNKVIEDGITVNLSIENKALVALAVLIFASISFNFLLTKTFRK